jgi:hypothetical protein
VIEREREKEKDIERVSSQLIGFSRPDH